MGVNRQNVICNTCSAQVTLRITLGTNTEQNHTFACPVCSSQTGYGFYFEKPGEFPPKERFISCQKVDGIDILEDCVVNLHPDVPIPIDKLRDSEFFPNMHMMSIMSQYLTEDEMEGFVDSDAILEYWKDIKIEWDLYDNRKFEILHKRYEDKELIKVGDSCVEEFFKQLVNFFSLLRVKMKDNRIENYLEGMIDDLLETRRYRLDELLSFYGKSFFNRQLKHYKKALVKFFDAYNDLRQLRLLVRLDADINDYVLSSIEYEKTENVYVELFEIIPKVMSSLGLFLNIKNSRRYDEFSSVSIEDYLNSSTQNKITSLTALNETTLCPDDKNVDNVWRNALAHNDSSFDITKMEIKCGHRGHHFNLYYLELLKQCWLQLDYIAQLAIHDLKMIGLKRSLVNLPYTHDVLSV